MGTIGSVRKSSLRWLLFVGPLLVAGCAKREVTATFPTETPPPFSSSGEMVVPDRWWTTFEDPRLDFLVEEAFNGSFTLAAALQRLRAARALTRREASDLWPDVDGVAEILGDFGPGRDRGLYTWGFDVSYQVDLWGQIESRVEAERLRAAATGADYQAIALTLSAEITRTWLSLIEAHAQLELLDEQIESNLFGLELQEGRFGQGQSSAPDVWRQRQLVESTREQAAVVKARIDVLEHQLAVLLGQMPQEASYEPGTELPALAPLPDTGLPSELLTRRPDVRRDFLAFMAADRDVASAISAQYPRLNLSGSVLNVADQPETLFRDWFVVIGGQLIAPLIDGGQRRAEVDRTGAVVRQRFNEYGETVLNALREVEDSLALERYQLERIGHLEEQTELAGLAAEVLLIQYSSGAFEDVSYLDVLSSKTAEQRLQRELLAARLELLLIRVGLYLALAGGFEPRPQDPWYCEPLRYRGEMPVGSAVDAAISTLEVEEIEKPEAIREDEGLIEFATPPEFDDPLDSDGLLEVDMIPEAIELPEPEPALETDLIPSPLQGPLRD